MKSKRIVSITRRKNRLLCQLWAFNIRKGETFHSTKVNLVLNTHALQIILFGSVYVRTQYHFGSLQIESLHYLNSNKRKLCSENLSFFSNDWFLIILFGIFHRGFDKSAYQLLAYYVDIDLKIEKDVNHKIGVGWMKWRNTSWV